MSWLFIGTNQWVLCSACFADAQPWQPYILTDPNETWFRTSYAIQPGKVVGVFRSSRKRHNMKLMRSQELGHLPQRTLLLGRIWCRHNHLFLTAAAKQQRPDGLVERVADKSIEHVGIVQSQRVTQPTDVDGHERLTQQHVQFGHVAVTMLVNHRSKRRNSCTCHKQYLQHATHNIIDIIGSTKTV